MSQNIPWDWSFACTFNYFVCKAIQQMTMVYLSRQLFLFIYGYFHAHSKSAPVALCCSVLGTERAITKKAASSPVPSKSSKTMGWWKSWKLHGNKGIGFAHPHCGVWWSSRWNCGLEVSWTGYIVQAHCTKWVQCCWLKHKWNCRISNTSRTEL